MRHFLVFRALREIWKSMRERGSKCATFAQNHNIWTHWGWAPRMIKKAHVCTQNKSILIKDLKKSPLTCRLGSKRSTGNLTQFWVNVVTTSKFSLATIWCAWLATVRKCNQWCTHCLPVESERSAWNRKIGRSYHPKWPRKRKRKLATVRAMPENVFLGRNRDEVAKKKPA